MLNHWYILLFACWLEAAFGYPRPLYAYVRHPVVWMGACIEALERNFNRPQMTPRSRRVAGVLSMAVLLALTGLAALALDRLGWIAQAACIGALLAQRSLYAHVREIYDDLKRGDVPAARKSVARIVGRDTDALDEAGICRAAIESLSESFSDGVAAPLFWAAWFGLPGIACYKAINTADSMIGHKDERFLAYGWAAAKLDDAANYLPARLSALLLILAAWPLPQGSAGGAWRCMRRDARRHASPNAGWPEAAMAGALGIGLGGAKTYGGVLHPADGIGGQTPPAPEHLRLALQLYLIACGLVWAMLLLAAL